MGVTRGGKPARDFVPSATKFRFGPLPLLLRLRLIFPPGLCRLFRGFGLALFRRFAPRLGRPFLLLDLAAHLLRFVPDRFKAGEVAGKFGIVVAVQAVENLPAFLAQLLFGSGAGLSTIELHPRNW